MQFSTMLTMALAAALTSAQSTVHITMAGATTTQTTTLYLGTTSRPVGTAASPMPMGTGTAGTAGTGNGAAPSNGTIVAPTLSAAGPTTVTSNLVLGTTVSGSGSANTAKSSAAASTAGAGAMSVPMGAGALAMGLAGIMAML